MDENVSYFHKSPISRWKRSDHTDTPHVSRLITEEVTRAYGPVDLSNLIEGCSASITLYNEEEKAVAFAVLCDYPNIPSIMYSWPKWIVSIYGLNHLNTLNTQFIHLMAFDDQYYPEFFPQMMEKFYQDNDLLDFVVLLLPPKATCYNLLNMYFNRVHKLKDISPEQLRACYVNNRWLHFGKFALRKIGEDDPDPIIVKVKKIKSEGNRKKYRKIIIHKDKFRTSIIEETPVAGDCICLNTKINYGKLIESYDLRTVNGFKSKGRRELRLASIPVKFAHVSASVEHGYRTNNKMGFSQFKSESVYMSDGASHFTEENLRYEDVVLLDPGRLLGNIPYMTRQASDEDKSDMLQSYRPHTPSMFKTRTDLSAVQSNYEGLAMPVKRKDFIGSGNAFSIELFIAYNKKARSIDYIRKIFEFSPDNLNFCLLELPFNSTPPAILNYFHKFEKLNKSHPCELYATHQLAITGTMTVRESWPSDMDDLIGMTISTPYASVLIETVHEIYYSKDKNKQVYVMLCENLIIGVAVVYPETRLKYLKANYQLDELICTSLSKINEYGEIIHFIVSPIFYHYVRFFLKEIMRLTGYKALFFLLYCKKTLKTVKSRTWPCGLQRWVPISPRRLSKSTQATVKQLFIQDESKGMNKSFALFFINRRIASMTLHLDNRDLVVVGGGNAAISFIESLVYSKKKCYFNFSNIKMVAPDAFVTSESTNFELNYKHLVPKFSKYSFDYMDTVALSAYVDHVTGRMTRIDRERRTIEIDFSFHLHYDYLFLLCGTQFTRPDMKNVVDTETNVKVCTNDIKGKTLEDYYSDDFPINLFILDTMADIDMFINFIVQSYSHFTQEDYLVIYGGRINAWTCLNFLLRYVPGNEIAFVENLNESSHSVDAFNNPLIHEACKIAITNAEVKYYSSYVFSDWEVRKQNPLISKVNFLGEKNILSLKCVAFVSFSPKTIHPITIMALNETELEFDGKLVIDNKFRTTDSRIYAAGSMTAYSKEYYYDHFNHENYNSIEVGKKLADIFLEDDCKEDKTPYPEPEVPPLVEMTEPVVVRAVLPSSINYIKISPPGPQYPFEQLASLGLIGKIMTTGDVFSSDGPKYFRILLDKFKKIMEITCFTNNDIDVVSLSRLYGKHEQLLNDLCYRYDNDLISDFYEYFNQPWASAIYHDKFTDFLQDIFPLHQYIKNTEDKEKYLKLAGNLRIESNDDKKVSNKVKMMSLLNRNGLDRGLCEALMAFLEVNKALLPMYLTPSRLEKHKKERYLMNQLLEPPRFASEHLMSMFDPVTSQSSNKSTLESKTLIDEVSKLIYTSLKTTSSVSVGNLSEFKKRNPGMDIIAMIKQAESVVHLDKYEPSNKSLPNTSSSSISTEQK